MAWLRAHGPGILLCAAIVGLAMLVEWFEVRLAGQPYLETVVLAILIGVAVRFVWTPGPAWGAGISFSAKTLLEVAVVLLGASLSTEIVLALGPVLIIGIAIIVAVALVTSYAICRALGLPPRMAILIACGNSICGNSAIAAVAPVIGAKPAEVASSIAFTAVLGVVVVLGLPLLVPVLDLSLTQYGVLAGLTVYAVPQVLAATLPIGAVSNQIGTVVKLVRVLMLGPLVLALALFADRFRGEGDANARPARTGWPPLSELVPWFIVGFLLLFLLRSLGFIPRDAAQVLRSVAAILTALAMAALGLGVDVRTVAKAGVRIATAVTASLIVLAVISYALIRLTGI